MKKELLFRVTKKDFDIQTFRSGGKGGQNQNKRDTGVRIIHRESKAVGEARDSRHQHQNKKAAFRRLIKSTKFQTWLKIKIGEMTLTKEQEEKIQRKVDEEMKPENLKIEYL